MTAILVWKYLSGYPRGYAVTKTIYNLSPGATNIYFFWKKDVICVENNKFINENIKMDKKITSILISSLLATCSSYGLNSPDDATWKTLTLVTGNNSLSGGPELSGPSGLNCQITAGSVSGAIINKNSTVTCTIGPDSSAATFNMSYDNKDHSMCAVQVYVDPNTPNKKYFTWGPKGCYAAQTDKDLIKKTKDGYSLNFDTLDPQKYTVQPTNWQIRTYHGECVTEVTVSGKNINVNDIHFNKSVPNSPGTLSSWKCNNNDDLCNATFTQENPARPGTKATVYTGDIAIGMQNNDVTYSCQNMLS